METLSNFFMKTNPLPPNVRTSGFSIPATYFEVYITHQSRPASAPELRRRGQSPFAFIEAGGRWGGTVTITGDRRPELGMI